jgi:hypothetical protein
LKNQFSKAVDVEARGHGHYFSMRALDDRWKLERPSGFNHNAAQIFVTCTAP